MRTCSPLAQSMILCCALVGASLPVMVAPAAVVIADPATVALPYRHLTQRNPLSLDAAVLRRIAQVNPHAALVLCDFHPCTQPSQVSIVAGRAVITGLPTTATVQLVSEGSSDRDAVTRSIRPLAGADEYVETEWSSARTPSGDLAVTFASHVMGRDGMARRAAYPTIAMTVQNASPSRILDWKVVR